MSQPADGSAAHFAMRALFLALLLLLPFASAARVHLPEWHPRHGDADAGSAELERHWGSHPLFTPSAKGVYGLDAVTARHAEVVARHAAGEGGIEAGREAGEGRKTTRAEWSLGSRLASAFAGFRPRHDAAARHGSTGEEGVRSLDLATVRGARHGDGVHALDWFGHRAAEERARMSEEEIEQRRAAVRAKVRANDGCDGAPVRARGFFAGGGGLVVFSETTRVVEGSGAVGVSL